MGDKIKEKGNSLDNLNEFLKEKFTVKPEDVKPELMSSDEMKAFYSEIVNPAFKVLINQLSKYRFTTIDTITYSKTATLKVLDAFSMFTFKIDIINGTRQIKIYCIHKYRKDRRSKLILAENQKTELISFRDIETINQEMIVSLFSEWYISKDILIK